MILHYFDQTFSVQPKNGQSLQEIAAELNGVILRAPCGGHGVCKKCTVVTVSDPTASADPADGEARLSDEERADLLKKARVPADLWEKAVARYACLCRNTAGITDVYLHAAASLTGAGVSDGLADPASPDFRPMAEVRRINLPLSDEQKKDAPEAVLRQAEELEKSGRTEAFAVIVGEYLPAEDFSAQKTRTRLAAVSGAEPDPLGLAVDIGTTTVAMSIWYMKTGRLLGETVIENPQRRYGADVIARMSYAAAHGDGELRSLIAGAVKKGCGKILAEHNAKTGENRTLDDIYCAAAAGNSVMEHLFLGLPTDTIAKAPFLLRTQLGYSIPVSEVFADDALRFVNPEAAFYFAPLAASYVGGDITFGLAYLMTAGETRGELAEDGKANALFLDLGTNGELCVIAGEANAKDPSVPRYLFAATAAGPALEGAQIKMGMSALPGAVSHVRLNREKGCFDCRIIGESEPAGVCGSGIISAVAAALDAGLITAYGRICDDGEPEEEEYEEIYAALEHALGEDDEGHTTITLCGGVSLTDSDVRQVQTAKAAIAAGTKVLTDCAGMAQEKLDRVYLAGSFGGGIDVNSAERIGLLPKESGGKVLSMGNTSAKGAVMQLFRADFRQKLLHIMKESRYIELSCDPAFTDAFVSGMVFGDDPFAE